jgi:Protein of unknown function (DUF2958)
MKMTLHFAPTGEFSETEYWKRQFPDDVIAQLAKNGVECCDRNGLPLEDIDPVPVARLFQADGRWECLLCYTYPNDPDRAFCLANLGRGAELGDVRISELKTVRGALRLPLERDRLFEGTTPISTYRGIQMAPLVPQPLHNQSTAV